MKIALLGHGVVGSGVRKIIDENNNSAVEIKRILVHTPNQITDEKRMTTNISEILNDPEIEVVVECMGGIEPARSYAIRAIQNGKHFVTSNKKMLAASFAELMALAKKNHVNIGYEASCGGGIPWMANLQRIKRIENIQSFRGIFNGTTNYILSRMYLEHQEFDDMLKDAQRLGYAEKDPTDDIDGFDVRYKVALSCAKAFDKIIDFQQIPTFGIRTIRKCDLEFARKNGYVVKLLGRANRDGEAFVMPTFIKQEDVFASIPLNFNALESVSDTLGPAIFIGQGAGSLPTAHAVVQDVLDIACGTIENDTFVLTNVDNTKVMGKYYVRTRHKECFASCMDYEEKNWFLSKYMHFNQLCSFVQQSKDDTLFVAEVME